MNKGIGFSRTVKLDWLDATASLCLQAIDPTQIRQQLDKTLSEAVQGEVARRNTLDVLLAIWLKTEAIAPHIREQALEIFPALTTNTERVWLHYGMTLVYYPFFRKCTAAIGQLSRGQETITRRLLKERLSGEYGHLGGLDRSVERVVASLVDWGALVHTGEKYEYHIPLRQFTASQVVQSWLLTCGLFAHPSEGLPYADLVRLPEFFPFNLTIGIDVLRQDGRFEVQRQGGGLEMVRNSFIKK